MVLDLESKLWRISLLITPKIKTAKQINLHGCMCVVDVLIFTFILGSSILKILKGWLKKLLIPRIVNLCKDFGLHSGS